MRDALSTRGHAGYWVGIEDDEPYAHHTALTKKFTTMERLHRTVISYAFILPMLISSAPAAHKLPGLAYVAESTRPSTVASTHRAPMASSYTPER